MERNAARFFLDHCVRKGFNTWLDWTIRKVEGRQKLEQAMLKWKKQALYAALSGWVAVAADKADKRAKVEVPFMPEFLRTGLKSCTIS